MLNNHSNPVYFSMSSVLHCLEFCRGLGAYRLFPLYRSKSFIFCGLYAALVFGGRHFMRERPKLNLRRPLALWSLSLAIFR